jgi:hypothetical protein
VLNGEKLYELNGTYYKEDRDSKGQQIYTVVGKNGAVNNTPRMNQQRNMVRRDDMRSSNVRDTRSTNMVRERSTNSAVTSAYSRNRGNSRGNNNYYANSNYRSNNYRYNNNYRYSGYRYSGYRNNGYYNSRYYVYNNRRYSFMYGPRYSVIPRHSVSIYFGGYPYYYNAGFFYGYYGGYYQPLFPPIGLRIGYLPYGYTTLYIGSYPYYYYNGIYYRQYDNNDYEVVDPPMGATVYNLPEGAKSVVLNGEKLYELNGTYYKEDRDSKGQQIYTVVGKNGAVNNTDEQLGAYDNETDNPVNVPDDNSTTAAPSSLQIGDIVSQLPEGSRTVTINGEKMYVTPDDTYLKEDIDNNGAVQYKVVGK